MHHGMEKPRRNPTADEAIKHITQEEARFHKLLDAIFTICELSGFHIENRLIVRDKKTGTVWR